MNRIGETALGRVMAAVRESRLVDATRLIQNALSATGRSTDESPGRSASARDDAHGHTSRLSTTRRTGLAETLKSITAFKSRLPARRPVTSPSPIANTQFLLRRHDSPAGSRAYWLFLPSTTQPRGLVVMLHGCKQTAEDYALGTDMNAVAERHGLLVAYPEQPSTENPMSCWNWFRPQDQSRQDGEAAVLADLARSVILAHGLQRETAWIAGLSAGGAMAVVLGATYPDVFSAVGVHSGLPYRCASDANSAFAAMRGQHRPRRSASAKHSFEPRLVVFHGSADQTVAASNAALLWNDALPSKGEGKIVSGARTSRGRDVQFRAFVGASGKILLEEWIIDGAGHAWSGGNPAGSYAEAQGPSASEEMVRFFLETPGRS